MQKYSIPRHVWRALYPVLIPALLVMAVSITLLIKRTKPAVLIPEPEVEPDPAADGGNSADGKPDEAVAAP